MQMELKNLTCVMHGKCIDINHDGLLLSSIVKVPGAFRLSPGENVLDLNVLVLEGMKGNRSPGINLKTLCLFKIIFKKKV